MQQNLIMPVPGESTRDGVSPSRSEIEAELVRVLTSTQFRNAPVLQSFLRFIAQRALDFHTSDLNEYTIASEVFGRPADFDSSGDTIVRTQAYRLRSKLNEFYRTEGAEDAITIEIPKGHYVPLFHARSLEETTVKAGEPPPVKPEVSPVTKAVDRRWRFFVSSLVAVVAVCCFLFGLFVGGKRAPTVEVRDRAWNEVGNDVDSFWLNFLGSDRQPVVAYTNAVFLASDSGDLLRFIDGPVSSRGALVSQDTAARGVTNRAVLKQSGATYYEDDMTGVGEVAGAVAITRVLYRLGAHPTFKRSRSISASDLKSHNVIFLGSPFVNQILQDLPEKPSFLFRMQNARSTLWGGEIVNAHPRPNELATYSIERASDTQIVRTDYGLISELPGLTAGRKVMVLAGLSTTGTQAAAEFVTSEEGIREMSAHLPEKHWPVVFDYLLRVSLNQGVDIIRSECVAVRP